MARSCSGVPSIHSSVSTSLPVRSQSTAGTRKSGSALVFSAISDSAAASSRRSISMRDRAAQGRRPSRSCAAAAPRRKDSRRAARRRSAHRDRRGSAARRSGRSTFTATALRPSGVVDLGAMHLRDRGGGDRRAERRVGLASAACRAPPRPRPRPRPAGTAPSCPAAISGRAPARRRPRRAASPGTGRA